MFGESLVLVLGGPQVKKRRQQQRREGSQVLRNGQPAQRRTDERREHADDDRRDHHRRERRPHDDARREPAAAPRVGDAGCHRAQEDEPHVLRLADGEGQAREQREGGLVDGGREEGEAREVAEEGAVGGVLLFVGWLFVVCCLLFVGCFGYSGRR